MVFSPITTVTEVQGPEDVLSLLGIYQADHRFRCRVRRSRAELRRRVLDPVKEYMQEAFRRYGHGLYFKGNEIRGIRQYVAWKKMTASLPQLPEPPAMPDFGEFLATFTQQPPTSTKPASPPANNQPPNTRSRIRQNLENNLGFADSYMRCLKERDKQPGSQTPVAEFARIWRSSNSPPIKNADINKCRTVGQVCSPCKLSKNDPSPSPTQRRSQTSHQSPPLTHPILENRNFVDQNRPRAPPLHLRRNSTTKRPIAPNDSAPTPGTAP